MSDNLTTAAEAIGVPEALVMRSAQARAATSGLSVEDILAAWAGGSAAPAGTASAPVPEAPAGDASDLPAESTTPDSTPMEPVAAAPEPEPAIPAEPKIVPARPVPETVGLDKAGDWDSVTTVATAGLKERTKTRVPSWLTAAFVVLPLVGLLYLLQFSGGPECGTSGLLAVDRISGEVVNCDGSPFEGRGAPGSGTTDFLALGQTLYADAQVACIGCHGANGEGGVGPAFTGGAVLTTFPTCADHVQWVQLGSNGWQAQVGAEYGAQGTLSQGGMPGFINSLSDVDLRSTVLFERVRFGGAGLDETLVDCGLVIPEPPADGEQTPPAEGEDGSTDSTDSTGTDGSG
jgi:hypothetical protein